VNLREVIPNMSVGVLIEGDIDLKTVSQGLPTIRLATLSKENITALTVSSLAINFNLYLTRRENCSIDVIM
jgi:hypothetical protein